MKVKNKTKEQPINKRAEEILWRSQERYCNALDNMLEGCQVIGFDFRYLYVNDAVAMHGRRTKKELWGHTMMEIYPGIENTEMFAQLRRCMEKRTSHRMVNEFTFPDGTKGWFELSMEPVPEGVLILPWDVTERKQMEKGLQKSEQSYRTLFEQSRDAVYITTREGRFVDTNQAMLDLFGYTREELLEIDVRKIYVDPADRSEFQREIEKKRSVVDYEIKFRKKDGTEMTCLLTSTVRLADDERVIGYQGIVRDITQHIRAEQALKEESDKAQNYLNIADVMLISIDAEQRVTLINRKGCELLGYAESEIIGKNWFDNFLPERVRAEVKAVFNKIISGEIGPTKYFTNPVLTRDGEERMISWHNAMITDREGRFVGTLSSGEDVTERERWEKELKLRSQILDEATDSIFLHDFEGNFVYVNETACRSRGYSRDELMGMNLFGQLDSPEYAKRKEQNLRELREKGNARFEAAHLCKDGSEIPVEVRAHLIESDGKKLILGIARDITERKKAEEALRESEERYRLLAESSLTGIYIVQDGKYEYVNNRFAEMHGFKPEELLGMEYWRLIYPDEREIARERIAKRLRGEPTPYPIEGRRLKKDGQVFWVELMLSLIEYRGKPAYMGNAIDITERRKTEKALKESEERYKTLVESSQTGIAILQDGKYVYANNRFAQMHGCTVEEVLGMRYLDLVHPDYREKTIDRIAKRLKGKYDPAETILKQRLKKDGQTFWGELVGQTIEYNGRPAIMANIVDVTERIETEEALRESEQKYRLLAESSLTGIFIVQDGKYVYVNDRFAQLHGYKPEELLGIEYGKLIHPDERDSSMQRIAAQLRGEIIPNPVIRRRIRKDGVTFTANIVGTLIEYRGKPSIIGNIIDITELTKAEEELKLQAELLNSATDSIFAHDFEGNFIYVNDTACRFQGYSKEEFMKKKLQEIVAPERVNRLPGEFQMMLDKGQAIFESAHLRKDGSVVPVEVHGRVVEYGDNKILLTVIRDITERKQAEEKLEESYAKLQKTVEGAIEAIGSIAETRDPYTAGHQRRVAKLASAIAEEMDLPKKKIETIRVAGILHDIGKMSVPTEILSKPSKLTDLEMGLVKSHPQAGREILKSLELPWPICQIVLQHHERADGSGYPNGMSGDNIVIEARILAVADTVEAMASHRPYRPSLGIEKALEEISKNKGILYDPDVVDACLKVFQEKGFKFE